jgi:methylated-DNA-[protein]-cysteine S-methyltransferase
MVARAFTLFETAIGPCGLAWSEGKVAGVQLPETDAAATRARMLARFPEAVEALPPADIAQARDAIITLLRGEQVDFSGVALDMEAVPQFHRRAYEAARAILPGETMTYGALARRIGAEGAARAVGRALARNPFPILVPCHRVLAANGKLGGFSAHGGIDTKRRLLAIEVARSGVSSLFEDVPPARRRRVAARRDSDGSAPAHRLR